MAGIHRSKAALPGKDLFSIPKSVHRCSTNAPVSTNDPSSRSTARRSRAVSFPFDLCLAAAASPPPASARARLLSTSAHFADLRGPIQCRSCQPTTRLERVRYYGTARFEFQPETGWSLWVYVSPCRPPPPRGVQPMNTPENSVQTCRRTRVESRLKHCRIVVGALCELLGLTHLPQMRNPLVRE